MPCQINLSQINRTIILLAAVTAGGWLMTLDASSLTASLTAGNEISAIDGEAVSLKSRLEKELRARRPSEFAFIKKVVERVDDKTLPRSIVDSTFLWARKKPQHKFQYFERAIKLRAKKIGVDL